MTVFFKIQLLLYITPVKGNPEHYFFGFAFYKRYIISTLRFAKLCSIFLALDVWSITLDVYYCEVISYIMSQISKHSYFVTLQNPIQNISIDILTISLYQEFLNKNSKNKNCPTEVVALFWWSLFNSTHPQVILSNAIGSWHASVL